MFSMRLRQDRERPLQKTTSSDVSVSGYKNYTVFAKTEQLRINQICPEETPTTKGCVPWTSIQTRTPSADVLTFPVENTFAMSYRHLLSCGRHCETSGCLGGGRRRPLTSLNDVLEGPVNVRLSCPEDALCPVDVWAWLLDKR